MHLNWGNCLPNFPIYMNDIHDMTGIGNADIRMYGRDKAAVGFLVYMKAIGLLI